MALFDDFGMMFGFPGDSGRKDDDPEVVDVQVDGDAQGGGNGQAPHGNTSVPRLGRRAAKRPKVRRHNGSAIALGIIAVIVVIVGLFFGLARFITDVMWFDQLGFQRVIWTQLGV